MPPGALGGDSGPARASRADCEPCPPCPVTQALCFASAQAALSPRVLGQRRLAPGEPAGLGGCGCWVGHAAFSSAWYLVVVRWQAVSAVQHLVVIGTVPQSLGVLGGWEHCALRVVAAARLTLALGSCWALLARTSLSPTSRVA